MKQLFIQLLRMWQRATVMHKLIVSMILLSVAALFGFQFFGKSHSNEVLLYSHITDLEEEEIKNYLDGLSIPYKDRGGLYVQAELAERVRYELSSLGVGVQQKGKGFELFDTNTWIKGEKELQVLEMRALKGQLEKDLAGFESIKSASVILDIAPSRTFGGAQYKTKASAIVTLMQGSRLTQSQLKAITYHLTGAVRGLEPEMVAISDTKGRLYQAQGETEVIVEEQIRDEIDQLCAKIFGQENYHFNLQMQNEKISVGVVVNRLIGDLPSKPELSRHLSMIGRGFGIEIEPLIDYIPFEKKRSMWVESKKRSNHIGAISFALFLVLVVATPLIIYFLRRQEFNKEHQLVSMMTKVDIKKLASSMKGEDPETIALMLSYLESDRAEKLLGAFPTKFQEEVQLYLESAP